MHSLFPEALVLLQDALGQPFLVPLTQPGLRARTKAARNDLAAARAAAEKGTCTTLPSRDAVWRFSHNC